MSLAAVRRDYWLAAIVLGVPAAAFAVLSFVPGLDRTLGTLAQHFYIVTLVALLALGLALAVAAAAYRLPDPRTFFLAAGFIVMAIIFFAHGAGTSPWLAQESTGGADPFAAYAGNAAADPQSADDGHAGHVAAGADETSVSRARLVGFSSILSLFSAAPFFALAVTNPRGHLPNLIAKHWAPLMAAIAAPAILYFVVALFQPGLLGWLPVDSAVLKFAVAAVTCGLYGFAGWRCFQSYRMALLPLQGTMALSMLLLIEAQVFLVFGTVGQLTWWQYHVVMLTGFFVIGIALVQQFRQTGDLGVVVEGLFLRDQITGLRDNDPSAMPALAAAVAAKDNETADHTVRVSALAAEMGSLMGFKDERLALLRLAGRLHDVGKIGVPDSVLLKPGKLTDAEFNVMKLHTVRGYSIAMNSDMLREAAPIIRAHHERIDGNGYPDGLTRDLIPIEARIIAVADFWDALTGDRPYRKGMSPEQAAELTIKQLRGHLDPQCVEALFSVLDIRPSLSALRSA